MVNASTYLEAIVPTPGGTVGNGGACYDSYYAGTSVNVTGVVTATYDEGAHHGFYMQEPAEELEREGELANATFNGIRVETSMCKLDWSCRLGFGSGDDHLPGGPWVWLGMGVANHVQVLGDVAEINGTTTIINVLAVEILGNVSIPGPLEVKTSHLGVNCTHRGEQYESMLVKVWNATILDNADEHGQISIADEPGVVSSRTEVEDNLLDIGDSLTSYFGDNIEGQILEYVTGVVDYCSKPCHDAHGNFEIHPRMTDDLAGLTMYPTLVPTPQPSSVPTMTPLPSTPPTPAPSPLPTPVPTTPMPSAAPTTYTCERVFTMGDGNLTCDVGVGGDGAPRSVRGMLGYNNTLADTENVYNTASPYSNLSHSLLFPGQR